jgi:hypothetical protein
MKKIVAEKALYEPTYKFLHSKFKNQLGNCHLEITASGHFEETLKKAVPQDGSVQSTLLTCPCHCQ